MRDVYAGPLAYSANHDALAQLAPFQYVDVACVSAYFPLADDHRAAPEVLRAAWTRHAETLRSLAARVQKPLVVLEFGYRSVDGGAVRPWDYTHGAPIDLEEQRAAYAAFVDVTHNQPWLRGAFAWMWFGDGGQHDRHFTPRGKPAQAELQRLFRAR